jgi:hypothetical protein
METEELDELPEDIPIDEIEIELIEIVLGQNLLPHSIA